MITFKFMMDGREIHADDFGDELRKGAHRVASRAVAERVSVAVAPLQCADHGAAVTAVSIDFGQKGTIQATPCCQAMKEKVEHAIHAAFADK